MPRRFFLTPYFASALLDTAHESLLERLEAEGG
jgi:hypothetical protein